MSAPPCWSRWLGGETWPPWWKSLTLMFQREVAERIVAGPGTEAYGRLAVLAQWRAEPRLAMKVNRSAFVPPPKVMSAVVHIVPGEQPEGVRAATLERLTAAAFGQRRKMLRRSLQSLSGGLAALEHLESSTPNAAPKPSVSRNSSQSRGCWTPSCGAAAWLRRRARIGTLGGQHIGRRAALDHGGELRACGQGCAHRVRTRARLARARSIAPRWT